jgi:hypothetical protein
MKFFYFNPETRMGYISEPLSPEEAEVIAEGIGYWMVLQLVAILITAIIVLPFFIASGLDKFLISFCSINKTFILVTAIVLVVIKLSTNHLSSALIIRLLFALMIMVPVLYVLLYKFHMADITISIGKRFDATGNILKDTVVQTAWFDNLLNSIFNPLSKVFFSIYNSIKSIDYSAFSSSLSTINVGLILACIGKTILWWSLLLLFSLLIFAVGSAAVIILVGLPYFIAFGALILANNLIYNIKLSYIKHLKF